MLDEYADGAPQYLARLFREAIRKEQQRTPEERDAIAKKWKLGAHSTYHAELKARATGDDAPRDPLPYLERGGFGDQAMQRLRAGGFALEVWPAVAVARAWIDQHQTPGEPLPQPFLVLLGITGTGKTQGAAVAAARWATRNIRPRSTGDERAEILAVVSAELSTWSLWGKDGERRLDAARRARFLFLDDVGTEHLSGPLRAVIFDILNYRYAHRCRTVVAANMSFEALQQRLDQAENGRMRRRLEEAGWQAQVGREQGLLWVGGEERKFPEFDAPKRARSKP